MKRYTTEWYKEVNNERMNDIRRGHRLEQNEVIGKIDITDKTVNVLYKQYVDLDDTKFFEKAWFDKVYYSHDKTAWVLKTINFPDYIQKFNMWRNENKTYVGFSSLMNGHDASYNDVVFCKIQLGDNDSYYMLLKDCDITFPIEKNFFCYDVDMFENAVQRYPVKFNSSRISTSNARTESMFAFPGKYQGFYFPKIKAPVDSPLLKNQIPSLRDRPNDDKLNQRMDRMEASLSHNVANEMIDTLSSSVRVDDSNLNNVNRKKHKNKDKKETTFKRIPDD